MFFRSSDPNDIAAATRGKLDEAKLELAAYEAQLPDLVAGRAAAIEDIESGDYLKAVASIDRKINDVTANIAACRDRIAIVRVRLRSAEIACLEKRKAAFIAEIKKALPPRLRAAQKINEGVRLIIAGMAELSSADHELFRTSGWGSVKTLIEPFYYRTANTLELVQLGATTAIRKPFDFVEMVQKEDAGLIGLLEEAELPELPHDFEEPTIAVVEEEPAVIDDEPVNDADGVDDAAEESTALAGTVEEVAQ